MLAVCSALRGEIKTHRTGHVGGRQRSAGGLLYFLLDGREHFAFGRADARCADVGPGTYLHPTKFHLAGTPVVPG